MFDLNENRIMVYESSDVGQVFTIGQQTQIMCEAEEKLGIKPGFYKVNVSIRQGALLLDHVVGVKSLEIKEEDFYGCGRYSISDMSICLRKHHWKIQTI